MNEIVNIFKETMVNYKVLTNTFQFTGIIILIIFTIIGFYKGSDKKIDIEIIKLKHIEIWAKWTLFGLISYFLIFALDYKLTERFNEKHAQNNQIVFNKFEERLSEQQKTILNDELYFNLKNNERNKVLKEVYIKNKDLYKNKIYWDKDIVYFYLKNIK